MHLSMHKELKRILDLFNEGKLEEALLRARSIANMYLTVPGFKYSIETWATLEEAYASIGQTPPG